ncbi:diguanylate cyclase [Pseudomonas caspiana]|uniref:diguanylate cyclase n=1 Tax=Pseudomonas caspiana TaxID=1451454 RepID=A0A1Y3P1S5_9PSED|nr:diguanylate cyclase [Pseudomonas caspiana]OUM72461.1 diguanylate cyclase AdrA [Pseudomonas caspiana]
MRNHDGRGRSFAKRIYWVRSVGVGIGFFSVAATMYPLHPPAWVWAVMLCNSIIWPPIALWLATSARQPFNAEQRNILVDSLAGGFWAGAMGFNPLPTVTVLAMMAMHNLAAGGKRLFLRGLIAQMIGAAISWYLFRQPFVSFSTPTQIYACLPVLVFYPMFVGYMSYRVAVKLSEHKHILGKLSRTDSLTGLINHGSWKDLLQLEFNKSVALSRQTSIALIDIDHFKAINDTQGHIVGDSVLKRLSTALLANLRDSDLAGRYGGDEFCVILPNTSATLAWEILEQLRRDVHALHDPQLPHLRLSLSIGISTFGPHLADAAMWLNEADKALYIAKTTGRNRVCSAAPTATDYPRLGIETSAS